LEIVKPVSTYLAKFNEQSRFDDAEIRQEQDAAFQATLRLDQEHERQKLEAEEAKLHEEEAEKARIQADIDRKEKIARQKIELASKIPDEPPVNEPTTVRIVIKLPEGQRLERRFHKSQSLKVDTYLIIIDP
jgi:FAS-associated factor 2